MCVHHVQGVTLNHGGGARNEPSGPQSHGDVLPELMNGIFRVIQLEDRIPPAGERGFHRGCFYLSMVSTENTDVVSTEFGGNLRGIILNDRDHR